MPTSRAAASTRPDGDAESDAGTPDPGGVRTRGGLGGRRGRGSASPQASTAAPPSPSSTRAATSTALAGAGRAAERRPGPAAPGRRRRPGAAEGVAERARGEQPGGEADAHRAQDPGACPGPGAEVGDRLRERRHRGHVGDQDERRPQRDHEQRPVRGVARPRVRWRVSLTFKLTHREDSSTMHPPATTPEPHLSSPWPTCPGRPCPIAASLELVGERWSLLVVRELALGAHRFTDIVAGTGAPRDRIAARLKAARRGRAWWSAGSTSRRPTASSTTSPSPAVPCSPRSTPCWPGVGPTPWTRDDPDLDRHRRLRAAGERPDPGPAHGSLRTTRRRTRPRSGTPTGDPSSRGRSAGTTPRSPRPSGWRMAGIDYLRAMVDGHDPAAADRPADPDGLHRGRAGPGRVHLPPDESAYNPIGAVHGGLVCTLLDSVAGCALHSTLPAGKGYTSVEIKVSYLKAVRASSGLLTAVGTVVKAGLAGRLHRGRRHRRVGRRRRDRVQHAAGLRPADLSAGPPPDLPSCEVAAAHGHRDVSASEHLPGPSGPSLTPLRFFAAVLRR